MESRVEIFLDIISEIPIDKKDREVLAAQAGVHKQTLYNWKFGATMAPRISTLVKVAGALGLDICLRKKVHRLRSVS